jgi:calcium-dependent protein kinase
VQALNHPWLKEQGVASDKPMDSVVITRIQQFAANSRFKKAAISVMASCLTPAELSGLEHLFQSIDADGDGTITAVELKQALQSMGSKIPDTELQVTACPVRRHARVWHCLGWEGRRTMEAPLCC